jgi:transcriptional regulator CtsR
MRNRIHEAMLRIERARTPTHHRARGSVVGRVHKAAMRLHGSPSDLTGTNVFNVSKGNEVEARIGSDGKFRRAVVVKKPKHGRWVHVMDDVSKKVVQRVPTKLLRQVSEEGAEDVEHHGGDPYLHSGMRRKLEVSKGNEVEARIGSDGKFRRVVVVKKPKHGRWVHVMDDVSKKVVQRVPTKLLRQVSEKGAEDVEHHGGDPHLHSGMKRKFEVIKGVEAEAKIGHNHKYRRVVVVKKPKHGTSLLLSLSLFLREWLLLEASVQTHTHTHTRSLGTCNRRCFEKSSQESPRKTLTTSQRGRC